VILASQWGWTLFPGQPSFYDLLLMAQLQSEERVGRRVRQSMGATRAQEEARLLRLAQYSE